MYQVVCKILAAITSLHTLHWLAEQLYHRQCTGGFFTSWYTHGSLTCKALRTVSDTMSSNMGAAITAALATATVGIPAVLRSQIPQRQQGHLRTGVEGM